jgi:hypothetical protein
MANPKTAGMPLVPPITEKNVEYENASPAERARHDYWKSFGYIPAQNCAKLKGRIIQISNGIQSIQTDSKEEGKRIIPQLGFTWIAGGEVGDYVELEYKVHMTKNVAMWTGRIIEKGRG